MNEHEDSMVTGEGKAPRVTLEDLYKTDPRSACKKALRLSQGLKGEERIAEIDRLLGNYGVEAIRGSWQNGYWCDIVADYSNTGDTYALTVIRARQDFDGSHFFVSSVGDFAERNSEKLGIV